MAKSYIINKSCSHLETNKCYIMKVNNSVKSYLSHCGESQINTLPGLAHTTQHNYKIDTKFYTP